MKTVFWVRWPGAGPFLAALVTLALAAPAFAVAGDGLVVHEWGTFTSLQDEQGVELSGINTDDEPVPKFVHNLNQFVLSRPVLSSLHWSYRQKGAPRVHPMVTMRLETPVIYFYPPQAWQGERKLDVSLRFRGGWLTEFYPDAEAQAPGLGKGSFDFGALAHETTSSLAWKNLRVGTGGIGPRTDDRVWLAPRNVEAANVTSAAGESERYLFYRGVGRNRAPLRAVMNRRSGVLTLRANFDEALSGDRTARIPAAWLVHVRADGQCAFQALGELHVSCDPALALATVGFRFGPDDFRPDNGRRLETAMHAALTAGGLFGDEATALLTTWQRSYFTSPGLRLFYLVPREWTDNYLPLALSAEAKTERVMVGRLELIGDDQRLLLDRLAQAEISDGKWLEQVRQSPALEKFLAGRTDFGDLGVPIPLDYQMYLDLGRFRNALVVHEEKARPAPSLTQFINTYQLHPFRVPEPTP